MVGQSWPVLQRLPGMAQPSPVQELNRPDTKTELAWLSSLA
jgi:hypothetical protein